MHRIIPALVLAMFAVAYATSVGVAQTVPRPPPSVGNASGVAFDSTNTPGTSADDVQEFGEAAWNRDIEDLQSACANGEVVKSDGIGGVACAADQTTGGVAADSIGPTELDDSTDTPNAGECVKVAAGATEFEYDTCAAGGGDEVSVDGGATTDPNFTDGGDINFTNNSNTITADVKPDSVVLTTDTMGNYAAGDAEAGNATGLACTDCVGSADLDQAANYTLTGDIDVGGGVLQVPNATEPPGTCDVGDTFMDTNATTGQRFYLCETANNFILQGDGGGAEVNDLATDGVTWVNVPDANVDGSLEADELVLAGDVDGTANANDLDELAVESELEAVLDLAELQGAVTDAQVPDNITVDLATTATTANNLAADGLNSLTEIDGSICPAGRILESDGVDFSCIVTPTSGGAHNILSTTHTDSTTGTVERGALLYGDATPQWSKLTKGTVGQVLTSDGTDVSWADPASGGAPTGTQYVVGAPDGTLTAEKILTDGTGIDTVLSGGDAGAATISLDYAATAAADPALGSEECVFTKDGTGGGLLCEGVAPDMTEGLLQWNPTTGDKVLTLPDATDTLVGRATIDTLTNKIIGADQLTGTVVAARVGVDHIDAITEIASAIKTGAGAGSKLLSTSVSSPGSPDCLYIDSDGLVKRSGLACALQTMQRDATEGIYFPQNYSADTYVFGGNHETDSYNDSASVIIQQDINGTLTRGLEILDGVGSTNTAALLSVRKTAMELDVGSCTGASASWKDGDALLLTPGGATLHMYKGWITTDASMRVRDWNILPTATETINNLTTGGTCVINAVDWDGEGSEFQGDIEITADNMYLQVGPVSASDAVKAEVAIAGRSASAIPLRVQRAQGATQSYMEVTSQNVVSDSTYRYFVVDSSGRVRVQSPGLSGIKFMEDGNYTRMYHFNVSGCTGTPADWTLGQAITFAGGVTAKFWEWQDVGVVASIYAFDTTSWSLPEVVTNTPLGTTCSFDSVDDSDETPNDNEYFHLTVPDQMRTNVFLEVTPNTAATTYHLPNIADADTTFLFQDTLEACGTGRALQSTGAVATPGEVGTFVCGPSFQNDISDVVVSFANCSAGGPCTYTFPDTGVDGVATLATTDILPQNHSDLTTSIATDTGDPTVTDAGHPQFAVATQGSHRGLNCDGGDESGEERELVFDAARGMVSACIDAADGTNKYIHLNEVELFGEFMTNLPVDGEASMSATPIWSTGCAVNTYNGRCHKWHGRPLIVTYVAYSESGGLPATGPTCQINLYKVNVSAGTSTLITGVSGVLAHPGISKSNIFDDGVGSEADWTLTEGDALIMKAEGANCDADDAGGGANGRSGFTVHGAFLDAL